MNYIFYPGCLSLTEQYTYEISSVNVLKYLGVNFMYPENINCCGLPLRNLNSFGWLYLSTRLIAALENYDKPCILLCNWCHVSITCTMKILRKREDLLSWVNELLSKEDLRYEGKLKFKHIIQFLYEDIGLEKLKTYLKINFNGLKFSIHPGCLYFRPRDIGRPDDSHNPHILLDLVKILGAETQLSTDCCGWAIYKINADVGLTLAGNRIKLASGTDGIVLACPHGGEMLDTHYSDACKTVGFNGSIPVLYYTQILGLSMGIEPKDLALNINKSPVNKLLSKLFDT
ncbi:MAG: CoB--CoM heterodisulfide reductase iron-sulfur subunit B family protein [Candidatus Methanomethylicia archaeon]|nr:CoB--CoM heterodisulfide reductase iron-sulfur subunit B family protein [Candidatus Methanomethylicia archaeon]